MTQLNIDRIKQTLKLCLALPKYEVLIVTPNFVKAKCIMNFIIENIGNNISDLLKIRDNYVIFDNGSKIYVMLNDYPFLGFRVNELIYDEDITEDVIKTIYEPMYMPYVCYSEDNK